MELKEGETLVKVRGTGTIYDNHFATVSKIYTDNNSGDNIGLTFGSEASYIFGAFFKADGITRFKENEFEIIDEIPVEIKCERIYGNTYHHIYQLKKKLNKDSPCMHEKCSGKSEKRALVNIHGVVYEIDLCNHHHKEWDGNLAEDFPFREYTKEKTHV